MADAAPRTWILTSSPDNHVATAERDFTVIGIKERNRARALPPEHWKLAFQGRLRTVSEADAALLMDRLQAAAGVPA
jgi:hypothetical protein